jgi:hypothetical protein
MSSDFANPYDSEANPSEPSEGNGASAENISASAVNSSQTDETTAKKPRSRKI